MFVAAPLPSSGCGLPTCCDRYSAAFIYRWLFHMPNTPMPPTSCARPPLMIGEALGAGAQSLATQGKPHAGVVFHRSSTVGLLLKSTPYTNSFPPSFVVFA